MKITVKFLIGVRKIVGRGQEELVLEDGSTVEDMLKRLAEKYGPGFKEYVFDEVGSSKGYVQFLVDGKNVAALNGLKTKLHDGCQVAIIPPMRGG